MNNEKAKTQDVTGATIQSNLVSHEFTRAGGVFNVTCTDKDGNVKWQTSEHNLVTNVGLKDMNDKYFTGSGYTAAWYLGLITGPSAGTSYASGDTMSSHAGWTEDVSYSQTTRPACSFGSATTADPSVTTNSGSAAVFSINATTTIAGAFLTTSNTKSGTTGILFSESDFQSPGDRSVVSGDTLTVTYTFSLDAA